MSKKSNYIAGVGLGVINVDVMIHITSLKELTVIVVFHLTIENVVFSLYTQSMIYTLVDSKVNDLDYSLYMVFVCHAGQLGLVFVKHSDWLSKGQ